MQIQIHDKFFEPYITEFEIKRRIDDLAIEIDAAYQNEEVWLLPILNGAFIFAADLVRALSISPEIQFVKVSTYGNEMESKGEASNVFGLAGLEVKGKHILIVEDIVDSGYTVDFLVETLSKLSPASIKIATLLFKPDSFKGKNAPNFCCFEIPSAFVVGYGLDYAQKGRDLRSIYCIV